MRDMDHRVLGIDILPTRDVSPTWGQNKMGWLPPTSDGIECAKIVGDPTSREDGNRDERYDDRH
jgi:hypothetical protein